MPDTGAPWELRYPAIGEAANVPEDMGFLAADAAAALTQVAAQAAAGPVPSSVLTNLFTAATGWSITNQFAVRIGWLLQFYVSFTRSGADISVAASGDVTNATVATLSPTYTVLNGAACTSGGAGRSAAGILGATGLLLAAVGGSGAITTGTGLSLGGIAPIST